MDSELQYSISPTSGDKKIAQSLCYDVKFLPNLLSLIKTAKEKPFLVHILFQLLGNPFLILSLHFNLVVLAVDADSMARYQSEYSGNDAFSYADPITVHLYSDYVVHFLEGTICREILSKKY